MIRLIIVVALMAAIVLSSELLWRMHRLRGEYARKYVHILAGVFVAMWPYILSKEAIVTLCGLSFVAIAVVRSTKLIHVIHDVHRTTIGEFLYPFGVLCVALFAKENWIFTTAVLFVALADGFAAVAGKLLGERQLPVQVFGMHKTYVGSFAYICGAILAMSTGALLGGAEALQMSALLAYVLLPIMCATLEALSPYGLDNVTVPLLVVAFCNLLV